MAKARDAFRTISEVAEALDTPPHVLRFWESKFTQVKPVKRAGGRRYYRPEDMQLLAGIKRLLHEDGLTIKGVQKILRERGIRHVAELAEEGMDPGPPEFEEARGPVLLSETAGPEADPFAGVPEAEILPEPGPEQATAPGDPQAGAEDVVPEPAEGPDTLFVPETGPVPAQGPGPQAEAEASAPAPAPEHPEPETEHPKTETEHPEPETETGLPVAPPAAETAEAAGTDDPAPAPGPEAEPPEPAPAPRDSGEAWPDDLDAELAEAETEADAEATPRALAPLARFSADALRARSKALAPILRRLEEIAAGLDRAP